MKKLVLAAALAVVLVTPARAQVFGQYTPAEILPVNGHLGGAYIDVSSNVVGLLGQLRLSFYPNVDFGFQGGLSRIDLVGGTSSVLRLGGDVRFGVAHASESFPVDIAAGAALGVHSGDHYSVLTVGPEVVASHTFAMSKSTTVVPFAGAVASISSLEIQGHSNSDFSLPLRLGAELRPVPGIQITAELDLRLWDDFNDSTAFSAGVNLPF